MPAASHSPDHPELELINPPSDPVKCDTNSNDILVMEDPGRTGDSDSIMGVSKDDADQSNAKSNSESDL